MRNALGLDVDAAPIFAATVSLTSTPSRPEPLVGVTVPSPDRAASIVDATVEAIASATVRDGVEPAAIAIVHPITWETDRVERLRRAITRAELPEVLVVSSAAVAAAAVDGHTPLPAGQLITVVALRSDGAEVQTLRKVGPHSYRESAAPVAFDGVPDAEFDDALMRLVDAQVVGGIAMDSDDPILEGALLKLRVAARTAREQLCTADSAIVGVRMPGQAALIQVQRADFQEAVEPALRRELPALVDAIRASAGGRRPANVILIGTAAPTPLLAELLTEALEVPVMIGDGRDVGAVGASLLAAATASEAALAADPWDDEIWGMDPTGPITVAAENDFAAVPVAFLDRMPDDAGKAVGRRPKRQRERRPLTLLSLWPVTIAAAVLVAFAGTAASGALTVVPAGDHPKTVVTDPAQTEPTVPAVTDEATPSPEPTVQPDPQAPVGTQPSKKPGTKKTSTPVAPVAPVVPVIPVPPTPTPTATPTPDPTPTETPTDPPPPTP